jgi:hypothetical protein
VPDEDSSLSENTQTAVTVLLQWAGRPLCAFVDAQQHPRPSKPVGSRSPKTPAPDTQTSDQHHNAADEEVKCSVVRRDAVTQDLGRRPYDALAALASDDHARRQDPVRGGDDIPANEHHDENTPSCKIVYWPGREILKYLRQLRSRTPLAPFATMQDFPAHSATRRAYQRAMMHTRA